MTNTVQARIGVAIATPIPFVQLPSGNLYPSQVSIAWHRHRIALSLPTNYNSIEVQADGLEVGEARTQVVDLVLAHKPRPKYLFFLDYDVLPQPDALRKLIYRAEHYADHDIFAGVYCCKGEPAEPLIYAGDGQGPYWNWSIGDVISGDKITGVHMGLTLIRVSLFDRLERKEGWFRTVSDIAIKENNSPLTIVGTEDLYFCRRAREEAGAKILVDTSVLAGHEQWSTGKIYGLPVDSYPVTSCEWALTKQDDSLKKAIDLGAGSTRRQWDGYRTYTTDIRDDVGADHVMDTLANNLPSDFYDLVASSHHFEHFGRFDQERLWAEAYRICAVGGKCEIIVPNVEWAAAKIIEAERGDCDDSYQHALNVLYGAQETHGYERNLNTHYFGYTPRIARALAESAGFLDVTVDDWRTNPELGYNLVVRGIKKAKSSEHTND